MKDTLALTRKVLQPVPLLDHGARLLLPFVRLTETSGSTSEALQCIVVLEIDFELGLSCQWHTTSLSGWLKGSSHLVPLGSSPPPTPPFGRMLALVCFINLVTSALPCKLLDVGTEVSQCDTTPNLGSALNLPIPFANVPWIRPDQKRLLWIGSFDRLKEGVRRTSPGCKNQPKTCQSCRMSSLSRP